MEWNMDGEWRASLVPLPMLRLGQGLVLRLSRTALGRYLRLGFTRGSVSSNSHAVKQTARRCLNAVVVDPCGSSK